MPRQGFQKLEDPTFTVCKGFYIWGRTLHPVSWNCDATCLEFISQEENREQPKVDLALAI